MYAKRAFIHYFAGSVFEDIDFKEAK